MVDLRGVELFSNRYQVIHIVLWVGFLDFYTHCLLSSFNLAFIQKRRVFAESGEIGPLRCSSQVSTPKWMFAGVTSISGPAHLMVAPIDSSKVSIIMMNSY